MIKRFILLLLLLIPLVFCLHAESCEVGSFAELMSLLNTGGEARVVIHYGDCTLISNNEEKTYSPNAIGGMSIDVYEYFPAGIFGNKNAYVVFSSSKLIENPIGNGYVYNYVKIKISDDDSVRIIARYLDPITFDEIMDESFYTTIHTKDNDGGVYIYTD